MTCFASPVFGCGDGRGTEDFVCVVKRLSFAADAASTGTRPDGSRGNAGSVFEDAFAVVTIPSMVRRVGRERGKRPQRARRPKPDEFSSQQESP